MTDIIRPPEQFFEQPQSTTTQTIQAQYNITFLTTKIEPTERGIMLYQEGTNKVPLLYPIKGWPIPENFWTVNIVKQVVIGAVRTITSKYSLLMLIGFAFTPWKYKIKWMENALNRFGRIPNWTLSTYYYKEQIWTPVAKELKKLIFLFLTNLKISRESAITWSKAIAWLIETDDAYRYRFQDVVSTINDLSRKSLLQAITTYKEREPHMSDKFVPAAKIFSYMLLIPKIKAVWQKTTQEINITALQLDQADRYHLLYRDGYHYLGQSFVTRYEQFRKLHNGSAPTPIQYTINNETK